MVATVWCYIGNFDVKAVYDNSPLLCCTLACPLVHAAASAAVRASALIDMCCCCSAVELLLLAGLYLVLVQPFRLGDKVAVSCSLPSSQAANSSSGSSRSSAGSLVGAGSSSGSGSGLGSVQGWFEGVCEKVDLRYTVLRWVARLWKY
jgi:uncharacterized membrane protein YgcG